MNTCGRHTDQNVTGFQLFPCKKIFFIDHAYCESRKVILILLHKSRMLGCFSADQSCSGLCTAFYHTAYDLCDLFRIILAACNIIQEKQRLCPCAGNIVDAHCHCIDSNGVMLVHNHGKLYLCSASVCSGNKSRLLHIFKCTHGKR